LKRKRTPQEKKALSYEKDYIVEAEYPHLFRRSWPRKKRGVNRRERRKAQQQLTHLNLQHDEEDLAEVPAKPVRHRKIYRWGPIRLKEAVQYRLEGRARRVGWNFFKQPYSSQKHRVPFIAFLRTLLADTKSEHAREVARTLSLVFVPPVDRRAWAWGGPQKWAWLQAFFRDEPEWEPRLRAWIAHWETSEDTPQK
jgi:hypothetical protein